MKKLNVKGIYEHSIISEDSSWKEVHKRIMESIDDSNELVEINLDGVILTNPWTSQEFMELIYEKRLRFTVTNNNELCNSVKIMCILEGIGEDKITNIVVEEIKEEVDKTDRVKVEEIKSMFKCKKGTVHIGICNSRYTQLGSLDTIEALEVAIIEYKKSCGWTDYIFECGDMPIIGSVIKKIAEVINNLSINYDIELDVSCNDKSNLNKIDMYVSKCGIDSYTIAKRRQVINNIPIGTCGILVKYKSSRATDEFGRHGGGEPIYSKMAIFRGISIIGDKEYVMFEEYSKNIMYTKLHWSLEHDCEIPPYEELPFKEVKAQLNDIGIYNLFVGSQFHFLEPIQQSSSENVGMNYFDSNNSLCTANCTIAERMKMVFDDWGVTYNKIGLNSAIDETKKVLANEYNKVD